MSAHDEEVKSSPHESNLPTNRHDSLQTVTEDNPVPPKMDHLDAINTVTKEDEHNSHNHNLGVASTLKHATNSAKDTLFLHHRHNKDLSKQFTPGSIAKHFKFTSHGTPKKITDPKKKKHLAPSSSSDPSPSPNDEDEHDHDEEEESHPLSPWQNMLIMATTFPYWNMAFWSGWCYTLGSGMFIISSAWSFAATSFPETEFPGETEYGVPLWFFFGACLYQVGGVMAYLEAVNDGCFAGAGMKRVLEGKGEMEKQLLDGKLHAFFGHVVPHHHGHGHGGSGSGSGSGEGGKGEKEVDDPELAVMQSLSHDPTLSREDQEKVSRRQAISSDPSTAANVKPGTVSEYLTWRWYPSRKMLWSYHIREFGYIACTVQLFGVTLYGVTSIVILPGILSSLEWWQELGAYWVPQVVASCCFLWASFMFTLMAQDEWWRVWGKFDAVSWWIGIWAILGSVGFLLTSIFGIIGHTYEWGEYQSSLSSAWGSFFYMLSGLFQWYEAINVNVGPVLAFPNNRTPVLLRKKKTRKEEVTSV